MPKNVWIRSTFLAAVVIACFSATGPSSAQGPATSQQFLAHYTATNLGNAGSGQAAERGYDFADSADSLNTFNRALRLAIPIGQRYPVSERLGYSLTLRYGSNYWQWSEAGGTVSATPGEAQWPAGLGWSMGFGALLSPQDNAFGLWLYEAADGHLVRFYDNHSGEAPTFGVYYSHDGSNLRLVVAGNVATVQWTNGLQRRFELVGGAWRIAEILDTYGNSVAIQHDEANNRIILNDPHGREQRIVFRPDPAGLLSRVIDRVELAGVGGTTLVYSFSYATTTVTSPAEDDDPQTPASYLVSLLTGISSPAQRGYGFTYHPGTSLANGRLATFTNRSGGTVTYAYEGILLPLAPDPASPGATIDHFAADGVGLAQRTALDFDGATLGTWTFRTTFSPARSPAPSSSQPHTLKTFVEAPGDHRYDYWHRAAPFDVLIREGQYAHRSEYGLPQGGNKLWETLSQIRRRADAAILEFVLGRQDLGCTDCLDPQTTRTHIRRYSNATADAPQQYEQTRTISRDWAGRGLDVRELDSLARQPTRITYRSGGGTLPGPNDPWVLQPFQSVRITESGSQSVEVQRCGDAHGRVIRQRQLRGAAPGPADFLTATQYDADGNTVAVEYYGGDSQALATGDLCTSSLPAAPPYRAALEWAHGTKAAAAYVDAGGTLLAEEFRQTIDGSTGLPVERSEGDGLMRPIEYDAALRISKRTVPNGATAIQTVVYSEATATTPYTVTRTLRDAAGTIHAESRIERDGFGRKISESVHGPGGWATEAWTYDALGRQLSHTASDGGVTTYLNYDYRGRPGTIRPPEGAAHDRDVRYSGSHLSVSTTSIAKNPGAATQEVIRTITSQYDREGRLLSQTKSDSDGETSERRYTYDIQGRWLTRTWNGTPEANLSIYDAAGLLVADGRGAAYRYDALRRPSNMFSKYGHEVIIGRDGAGRRTSLTYGGELYTSFEYGTASSAGDYRAGKLIRARHYNRRVPDVAGELIVVQDEYSYAGMAGRISDRLTTLEDAGGNVILTFQSSASYTAGGRVAEFQSPGCSGSTFYSCTQQSRTYAYAYDLGHLISVTEQASTGPRVWIEDVQFDAQNRVSDYRSGNGLGTELFYDPSTADVDRVIVRGATGALLWDSGTAVQDGNGETTAYGSQQWMPNDFYQHRGFLPQATAFETPPPNSQNRVDPFGNPIAKLVGCSAYPPCQDINVYNHQGNRVWYRQRPFSWPQSPIGLKTPSILELRDLLGRAGSSNEGFSVYFNDWQNFTITLTASYGSNLARRELIHGQEGLIGRDFYVVNPEIEYFHSSLDGRVFGHSRSDGSFTPTGEIE